MKKTVNISHVRAINQRAVLDAIFKRESVSKAELARLLHLSKPAMADNVGELLRTGIVQEIGEGESAGGGRKPMLLSFCKDHRYIIAVDFYYQVSIFVLSNLRGEIVTRFAIRQTPHKNFDSWVQMSVNAVATLLSSEEVDPAQLAAIGVSSPGIISSDQENVINSTQFGAFDPLRLYDALTRAFRCPVYIKNSTNAAAIGEWDRGAAVGMRNLIYVSCGQGLGAGIILRGKLYEGSRVAAGEIGNFITPGTMGLGRSLESRVCIDGLLERVAREAPAQTREKLAGISGAAEFERLLELWKRGDPFLVGCVREIGDEIGCVISNLVMTLNCDLVVLGGEYLAFQKQLLPQINEIVRRYCVIPARVVASVLGDSASSSGMTTMCRELYFDRICGLEDQKPGPGLEGGARIPT